MRHLRQYLHDRRGELYVDFLVKFFLAIAVVVSLVGFFDMFMKHQHLVFVAKRLVRAVEVTGEYGDAVDRIFYDLRDNLKLDGADFTLTNSSTSLQGHQIIQLQQQFVVEVTYPMKFHVADIGQNQLDYEFTVAVTLSGMSEVYNKDIGGYP